MPSQMFELVRVLYSNDLVLTNMKWKSHCILIKQWKKNNKDTEREKRREKYIKIDIEIEESEIYD